MVRGGANKEGRQATDGNDWHHRFRMFSTLHPPRFLDASLLDISYQTCLPDTVYHRILLHMFIIFKIRHIIGLHFSTKKTNLYSSKAILLKAVVESFARDVIPTSILGVTTHSARFINVNMSSRLCRCVLLALSNFLA